MAPRFFGRYEHSLDVKGRVILPARFRVHFGTQAYVTQYEEGCLALWTSDDFEQQMAEHERLQQLGRTERNLARVWASGSAEVDIDRQGRVAIPGYLREFAHLDSESPVLVNGALNRVELWNPAEWERRVRPAEAHYTEDPELAGDSQLPGSRPVGPAPDNGGS